MPRLTITLDEDLYAMARSHAIANRISISKAIGDLLRRRVGKETVAAGGGAGSSDPRIHPLSGFPVSESDGRPFTSEDVRRAEEDAEA